MHLRAFPPFPTSPESPVKMPFSLGRAGRVSRSLENASHRRKGIAGERLCCARQGVAGMLQDARVREHWCDG